MSDFNNQREVWQYISSNENNRVKCNDIKAIYGFKNGELWNYTEDQYTELYFYRGSDWSKYVPPKKPKGMIKLGNLARAYEELVKGNRVYKCYKNSKSTEWSSVSFVNNDLVYEDGSSGLSFFHDGEFDKYYIKDKG